eukprot:7642871-Ditylum_brightwellii.AAC.1
MVPGEDKEIVPLALSAAFMQCRWRYAHCAGYAWMRDKIAKCVQAICIAHPSPLTFFHGAERELFELCCT